MNSAFEIDRISTPVAVAFIDRLEKIYAAMDSEYKAAADHYGFNCDGCQDNCCQTRFYHHTMVEYLYVFEGLKMLTPKKQTQVKLRAVNVVDETAKVQDKAETMRLMCPLNVDELCLLYAYRPMICRLHGIAHELKKPGQNITYGPGCDTFAQRCGQHRYFKFDRTPFYQEMAKLEGQLRKAIGFDGKLRMTIAEMIIIDA